MLELLDALAHAHARGIVHRDLKPGNVLIDPSGERTRYLLTDFGLAHATDPTITTGTQDVLSSTAGTPHYMPPEQLEGHWRDYDAWTDLYALGCMCWELACGAPPFDGDNFIALASKHLYEEPGEFGPRMATPPELEAWLRRLLAKEPRERYLRAADAAWAIRLMSEELVGPAEGASSKPMERELYFAPTLASHDQLAREDTERTLLMSESAVEALATRDRRGGEYQPPSPPSPRPRPEEVPPLPQRWSVEHTRSESLELVGAGLGLFGLREVPFVDRAPQRDAIWQALREVHAERAPRVVIVRGEAGAGKSRLVEWTAQRAEEVGGADTIRVHHDTIPGPIDGLGQAIQGYLRCGHLDRAQTYARTLRIVRPLGDLTAQEGGRAELDAAAFTELMHPALGDEPAIEGAPVVHFGSPGQRYEAIARLLGLLGTQRPVILWVDDAQWGEESLALVRHLLARAERAPVPALVAITARDDELRERPEEAALLEELAAHERARQIELAPLDPTDHVEFVRQLLGMEPWLVEQVTQRTEGNPLFAVQIVGDWVERGLFEVGAQGFTLPKGVCKALPRDIYELWRGRLAQLEAQGIEGWQIPLELAAALGQQIDLQEWLRACARARAPLPSDLTDWLLTRGMLQRSPREAGLLWRHGILRESVARMSREAGRWHEHHRLLARVLAEGPRARRPMVRERRALHLLRARELREALGALEEAGEAWLRQSGYDRALRLTELHAKACDDLGLEPTDLQRARIWPLRATVLRYTGREQASFELGQKMLQVADSLIAEAPREAAHLRAEAQRVMTTMLWLRGDEGGAAERAGREALELYEELGDELGMLRVLHSLGWVLAQQCRFKEATAQFERGDALGQRLNEPIDHAWCLAGLIDVSLRSRNGQGARELARRAHELFVEGGSLGGQATCLVSFGDLALLCGDPKRAAQNYNRAIELWERINSVLRQIGVNRMALLALEQHDWEGAAAQLGVLHGQLQVNLMLQANRLVGQIALHAAHDEPELWDECMDQLFDLLGRSPAAHPNFVRAMCVSARVHIEQGDRARAARALELARWTATALTNQALLARVEDLEAQLPE